MTRTCNKSQKKKKISGEDYRREGGQREGVGPRNPPGAKDSHTHDEPEIPASKNQRWWKKLTWKLNHSE